MTSMCFKPKNDAEKAMWDYMSACPEVTHAMIKDAVDVSDYCRTNFVAKLKRLGLLHECGKRDGQVLFSIHDGEKRRQTATEKRQSPQGAMWTIMRVLKTFSPLDIHLALGASHPEITQKVVTTYCQQLLRADYFRVIQKANKQRPARYQLIKDTGPLPPTVQRKAVIIDGNDGKVAHVEGAQL